MSKKNPEYDFKWCPGCGDFGVKRALEMAVQQRNIDLEMPMANTVVVAGIGCSGNVVHLYDGDQPFGLHGIHGRTLPISFGVKMANPDLNVVIVSGDGDFLSIGGEHIAPMAQRNLNVTAVVMDNGVYGLTKGQSSPTTELGVITPTTPFGKLENPLNPLELYLTLGVSFVASGFSSKIKDLTNLISQGMQYPGFSIVHVQSPCTTYNDNYDLLKGNTKKGIDPIVHDVPESHDSSNKQAAYTLLQEEGIPLGIIYQRDEANPLDKRVDAMREKANARDLEKQIAAFQI
jgi:2-oxoglutarate ferredoxin oxidoreductase subunit beta